MSSWPDSIVAFELFLVDHGLQRTRCIDAGEANFGDKLAEYTADTFVIRILSERGRWSIEISPIYSGLLDWSGVEAVYTYLMGNDSAPPVQLDERIHFLQTNWVSVTKIFSCKDINKVIGKLDKIKKVQHERDSALFKEKFKKKSI